MKLPTLQHHDGEVVRQVRLLAVLVVVPEVRTVLTGDLGHDDTVLLLLLGPPHQHGARPLSLELLVQEEN